MEIKGVSHPIPKKLAKRIYEDGKTVFVGKSYLGKASSGSKFIIYESYGSGAYTGWATIKSIQKEKTFSILRKYKDKLMITPEEFKNYSKGRPEMTVIEFKNFQKFKNPVVPERYVSLSGKYIYEDEFAIIKKVKDKLMVY